MSQASSTLPIYEAFYAFQGEGSHIGRAAFFIRTVGCPVRCSWCDSPGTWHKDHQPKSIQRLTVEELVVRVQESGAPIAVITGGEPTIYDLGPLTQALQQAGIRTHLETCGAFDIRGSFDWITVSPKWNLPPLQQNIQKANEIKIVVDGPTAIEDWWAQIGTYCTTNEFRKGAPDIWLQPEANQVGSAIHDTITNAVKCHPNRYRAGVQLHKIYSCDALDPNSVTVVG